MQHLLTIVFLRWFSIPSFWLMKILVLLLRQPFKVFTKLLDGQIEYRAIKRFFPKQEKLVMMKTSRTQRKALRWGEKKISSTEEKNCYKMSDTPHNNF